MREVWRKEVNGCPMYVVTMKLKIVKQALKVLNTRGFGEVEVVVVKAKGELAQIQMEMHGDLSNIELCTKEKVAQVNYRQAVQNQLSFLRQKSKFLWLRDGDEKTKVFYQAIKTRRQHNRIHPINSEDGR